MTFTQILASALALFLVGLGARGLWRGEMPMTRHGPGGTTSLPPLRGWRAYLASVWALVVAGLILYLAFRGVPPALRRTAG